MPKSSMAIPMPSARRRSQIGDGVGGGVEEHGLGDLDGEGPGVEPGGRDDFGDPLVQAGPGDLGRAAVDADVEVRMARLPAPRRDLGAGQVQDAIADGGDDPGLLGHRDRLERVEMPAGAVGDPEQRLDGPDPAGPGLDDRLVVHLEGVVGEGQVDLRFDAVAVEDRRVCSDASKRA